MLVVYGEGPHTAMLALLPVAVVLYYRAVTRTGAKWKILAGAASGCLVLSNAFGITVFPIALLCLLLAFPFRPWWKSAATVVAIGALSYCWISPWLSPAMIRAIRTCAPITGGDFRYKPETWVALVVLMVSTAGLWLAMRRANVAAHLRFFVLFGWLFTFVLKAWTWLRIAIVPQPGRYHSEVDLALLLAAVFGAAAILDRATSRVRAVAAALIFAGLAFQTVHATVYAHGLIRSVDPRELGEYRVARWLDQNRPGQRVFLSGSASFLYNVFTGNPQLGGGHEQHTVNTFVPVVAYTIYSDMNAGERGADYSIFWLKAFGTHLITVPGPESGDYYKPLVHPRKFDGVLPLLWRKGDDSIYEVPSRTNSLAHVIPVGAVVSRKPIHGLDTAPAEAFVAALEDPQYPVATFEWLGLSAAEIEATVEPGQAVSVQVTYERGWEAWAKGKRQRVVGDALGQMVIEPDCVGPCRISLRYTGGWESIATRVMSAMAMLAAIAFALRSARYRRSPHVQLAIQRSQPSP